MKMGRPPLDTIPRAYNFAADIFERNLAAGRGAKTAYIDRRGSYSLAELADRVERFCHVLRGSAFAARSASCCAFSTRSTSRPRFSARSRPAWSPSRSTRCWPRTTMPSCWRTAGPGCSSCPRRFIR